MPRTISVGVLALQGAFHEHLQLLRQATLATTLPSATQWTFLEVRTPADLARCDALIIPGGESTTMALVAERSGLLEPLREFVKLRRKPTWGTCAGLILLAEAANRTKKGGQELLGGLDVRVNRNHYGRQNESFEADLDLPFLPPNHNGTSAPFHGIFIRAPVVEAILPQTSDTPAAEINGPDTVVAPATKLADGSNRAEQIKGPVEVLGVVTRNSPTSPKDDSSETGTAIEDIVAVRQGYIFGTSFHPELTQDPRIHQWWLAQVEDLLGTKGSDHP